MKLIRRRKSDKDSCTKGRIAGRRASGQAAVEFALVAIVLLAIVYGILEISRLLLINAELENAAREGVHYAALHPDNATGAYLKANVIGPHLTLIDKNSTDFTVSDPTFPNGVGPYYPVKLTVTYNYLSLINIIPDMRTLSLKPLGPILMDATSTRLIEGQ